MKKSIMFAMLGLGAIVLASVITVQAGWLPRGWGSEDAPDAALGAEQVLTRDTATSKVAQRAIWDAGNLLLTDGSTTNPILMSNQVAALIQNLAASGYMQYGTHNAAGATKSVTFNPSFTNTPKVVATLAASPQDQVLTIEVLSVGSSGFTYKIRNTGGDETRAIPINWVALAGGALPVISNTQSGVQWDSPVTSSLVPDTANTYNLGSEEKPFGSLYLSGDTIYMNGEPVITWNDQANAWQFGGQDDSAQFKNLKVENLEVGTQVGTGPLYVTRDSLPADISFNGLFGEDYHPMFGKKVAIQKSPFLKAFANLSGVDKAILGIGAFEFTPEGYRAIIGEITDWQWEPGVGFPAISSVAEQTALLTEYVQNMSRFVNAVCDQFMDVNTEFYAVNTNIAKLQEPVESEPTPVVQPPTQVEIEIGGETQVVDVSEETVVLPEDLTNPETSRQRAAEAFNAVVAQEVMQQDLTDNTTDWILKGLNISTRAEIRASFGADASEVSDDNNAVTPTVSASEKEEAASAVYSWGSDRPSYNGAVSVGGSAYDTAVREAAVQRVKNKGVPVTMSYLDAVITRMYLENQSSFGFMKKSLSKGVMKGGNVYIEGVCNQIADHAFEPVPSGYNSVYFEVNVVTKQVTEHYATGPCPRIDGSDQVEIYPILEVSYDANGRIIKWHQFHAGDIHITRF